MSPREPLRRIALTDKYIFYISLLWDMFPHRVERALRSFARRRSLLLKTVGYRILSVVVTVVIAFAFLRDASAAIDIGIWANAVKMGVYYAYERAWSGTALAAIPENVSS